jgi:hypothetical protein
VVALRTFHDKEEKRTDLLLATEPDSEYETPLSKRQVCMKFSIVVLLTYNCWIGCFRCGLVISDTSYVVEGKYAISFSGGRRQKNIVMNPTGRGTKNVCTGEGQQQFYPTLFFQELIA